MLAGSDFLSLLIMILILVGIVAFITQPLLRKKPDMVLENYYEETPLHELLGRKDALYQSIKDLEFDFKTAKLSEEDYTDLRAKLENEAVALLKRIDKAQAGAKKPSISSISRPAKKTKASAAICPECGAANETGAKFCVGCGSRLAVVCESCGQENKPDDKYCSACGGQLTKIKV